MGRRLQRWKTQVSVSQFRAASGFGGDDDDDEAQIYTNLFGDSSLDQQQDTQKQDTGPARLTLKEAEEAKKKPELRLEDIPEPIWINNFEISEERWHQNLTLEDIPDWSPDFVSRVSMERVQLLPGTVCFCFHLLRH